MTISHMEAIRTLIAAEDLQNPIRDEDGNPQDGLDPSPRDSLIIDGYAKEHGLDAKKLTRQYAVYLDRLVDEAVA